MKLLFKLLKIDLINNLSLNTIFSKKKKSEKQKSSKLIGLIIIYSFLALFLVGYTILFCSMFGEIKEYDAMIYWGVGLGGVFCMMMTLGQSYSTLFQSRDYELLATLPINKKTIVTSKLCSLLLVNYIYFNLPFITSVIVYSSFTGFQFYYIVIALLGAILGPLLAVTICSACAFVLGRLLSGFKYKNLLTSIVSMAFIILVFIFSFSVSSMDPALPDEEVFKMAADAIRNTFSKVYFVSTFLSKAFAGELLNVLWFVLVSLVPFTIFALLTAKNYVRINENQSTSYKNKNFKLEKQKQGSQFKALLKKEAKVFFSTSTYFMNVIVSPLLSCVVIIAMSFSFEELLQEGEGFMDFMPLVFTILLLFVMGMVTSSASSISMEGKQFWLIKCAPISPKIVLLVKSLLNVFICTPFILADIVLLIVFMDMSVIDSIVIGLTLLFANFAYSFTGTWINLINYKLDWDNPAQVVKSGANTLIGMLSSFLMDIILTIPLVISFIIGLYTPILMCICAILLAIAAYFILFTNGIKRYNNIEI